MPFEAKVALTVCVIASLLFLNVGNVYAASVSVIPNPVTQGASFQVSGTGFTPGYGVSVDVWATCFDGPPLFQTVTQVDGSGAVGPVTYPSSGLSVGTYCVWIVDDNNVQAFGSFTVAPPTVRVPVPFSICVIQLGVQEPTGTVTWLPGYAYPGTPISQCENRTDVLGEDVLGRTIMFHQFIQNRTFYKTVTVPV